jgi:hypothetical protein
VSSSQRPSTPIGSILEDLAKLGRVIAPIRTPQIRSVEARGHIKAVAMAWFHNYRGSVSGQDLTSIDDGFQQLLTASEKLPSAKKIRSLMKGLRSKMVLLQTAVVAAGTSQSPTDLPPTFAAVSDPVMRQILSRRWSECVACLGAGAPLAATVMMGGMLESLFLARVNRESNQAAIFISKAAPKDGKTQKPKSLREWGLSDYIAVAHELKWISKAASDVSGVLREYRNYIHPTKELGIQSSLSTQDARMFWSVVKELSGQIL